MRAVHATTVQPYSYLATSDPYVNDEGQSSDAACTAQFRSRVSTQATGGELGSSRNIPGARGENHPLRDARWYEMPSGGEVVDDVEGDDASEQLTWSLSAEMLQNESKRALSRNGSLYDAPPGTLATATKLVEGTSSSNIPTASTVPPLMRDNSLYSSTSQQWDDV